MTVIPGMGYFPDRPADPRQGHDCPRCGEQIEENALESAAECPACDWTSADDPPADD